MNYSHKSLSPLVPVMPLVPLVPLSPVVPVVPVVPLVPLVPCAPVPPLSVAARASSGPCSAGGGAVRDSADTALRHDDRISVSSDCLSSPEINIVWC